MNRSTYLAGLLLASLAGACTRSEPPKPAAVPPAPSGPKVETRELTYQQGTTTLKGFVAWDANATGKRPGVLVVHEWWGHNEHARNQARRLAEAGYVGFALDMYGDGKVTSHPDSAQKFVGEAMKDRAVLQARFDAALAQLKQDPHVDSTKVAAIGYCFGGAIVLSEARAGADLAAVGSFHGAIPPAAKVDSGKVKARVLIQTGGADPMVPASDVARYQKEIEAAGGRVEVITYPGAKHSFTNPNADQVGMPGLAYDPAVDRQSWGALLKLLGEVFPRG
jgi:dienelactone hydrolase